MSEHMSLDQARTIATGYGAYTVNEVRAASTIVKVGEVLARLDREYFAVADSNPRPGRDEHTTGYLAGIDTAYAWLQKTLEDHHE